MIAVIGQVNDIEKINEMEKRAKRKQDFCISLIGALMVCVMLSITYVSFLYREYSVATPIAMCCNFAITFLFIEMAKSLVRGRLNWTNFTPATYKYQKVAQTYRKGLTPTVYYQSTDSRDYFDMFAYVQSQYGNPIPVKIGTFKRKIVSINEYDDVVFDLTNMICLDPE